MHTIHPTHSQFSLPLECYHELKLHDKFHAMNFIVKHSPQPYTVDEDRGYLLHKHLINKTYDRQQRTTSDIGFQLHVSSFGLLNMGFVG